LSFWGVCQKAQNRLGVGPERVRQLENQAIWRLSRAWHPNGAKDLSTQERAIEGAPSREGSAILAHG
jgi:hypothetical protein